VPSTAQQKRQAIRQANQVAKINRKGAEFIRRYTKAIHDATILANSKGKDLVLPESVIKLITDEMVVFSVAAYLTATQQLGDPKRVALALTFNNEVKRIAKGFDINIGTLSKQMRDIVAPNVRDSLTSVRKRINETLSEVSAKKIPTKQAKTLLVKRLEEMGVSPRNKGYAETLVRTHGQLSWGAAQANILKSDPDVWGYQYVTVGDDRVREEHEELDGIIRKKDDPIWNTIWAPNGWNCRCQVLAIYEPERQTPVPKDYKTLVDPAFRFNPAKELA
jgi:SPP1 gp7 family putative phage head morphogenesis protein